jgi:hypothetical protein
VENGRKAEVEEKEERIVGLLSFAVSIGVCNELSLAFHSEILT